MKLALFGFPQFPDMKPDVINESVARYSTMVRISEWVDVDFPPRDPRDLLIDKINNTDGKITIAKKEKDDQLARLELLRSTLAAELVLQS